MVTVNSSHVTLYQEYSKCFTQINLPNHYKPERNTTIISFEDQETEAQKC